MHPANPVSSEIREIVKIIHLNTRLVAAWALVYRDRDGQAAGYAVTALHSHAFGDAASLIYAQIERSDKIHHPVSLSLYHESQLPEIADRIAAAGRLVWIKGGYCRY